MSESSRDRTESTGIAAFLERFPPFRDLDSHHLSDLAEHVEVASYPPETVVLRQTGEPSHRLFVVKSGIVDLTDEGRVVDHLGEGDVFGLSVLSDLAPALSVRARTVTECFLIDADRARELLGTSAGLAFLGRNLARWRERDSVDQHLQRAGAGDALAEEIARASDLDSVVTAAGRLPSTVRSLLDASVDPIDIGHVVGMTIDHLTTRLVELAVDDAGEPPTTFAWIALGSAARHEQALATDQDHALAYGCRDSEVEAVDPYFARLAGTVTEGLEACGIPRCRGGVMAENPAWRRTVDGWRERFGEYVADPGIMGTRIAGIAFDYRRVLGPVDVEAVLDEVIRRARTDDAFMQRLARTVLETRAPLGRLRDVVTERGGEHVGTLDIKHGGITLVTNLARLYAIQAGISENRTVERLHGAASDGVITDGTRQDLEEALRVLWRIRLQHHVDQIEAGAEANDHVDPSSLRPMTRRTLAASLHIIAEAQERLAKDRRGSAR